MAWGLAMWFEAELGMMRMVTTRLLPMSTIIANVMDTTMCPSDIKVRLVNDFYKQASAQHLQAVRAFESKAYGKARHGLVRPYYRLLPTKASLVSMVSLGRVALFDELEKICDVKYSGRVAHHNKTLVEALRVDMEKRSMLTMATEQRILRASPEVLSIVTRRHKLSLLM